MGASWEGFVLEAVIARLGARLEECFFWATYSGAELDLFVIRGRHRIGVEIKRTTAPDIKAIAFRRLLDDLPVLR